MCLVHINATNLIWLFSLHEDSEKMFVTEKIPITVSRQALDKEARPIVRR